MGPQGDMGSSVQTDEIDDLAVTAAKIAAGAVVNSKLGDGAVDTEELATDAVTAAKVADNETLPVDISGSAAGTTVAPLRETGGSLLYPSTPTAEDDTEVVDDPGPAAEESSGKTIQIDVTGVQFVKYDVEFWYSDGSSDPHHYDMREQGTGDKWIDINNKSSGTFNQYFTNTGVEDVREKTGTKTLEIFWQVDNGGKVATRNLDLWAPFTAADIS